MTTMQMMEMRSKFERKNLLKRCMLCFWKLCQSKMPAVSSPMILTDTRVKNPLYLEEMPSTKFELKALEGAIIDTLIAVHYSIEDAKQKLVIQMRSGSTEQVRAFLARKTHLLDKKFMLEQKLEKVQAKLRAFE
jgi:hypothetical protein